MIPAGGRAKRLAPLPCSKELYPIGFRRSDKNGSLRPKVVCHYLLEKMRLAGIMKTYIVLREGKWDIPSYLGDGMMLDMNLAYLIMRLPFGVPYTIDQGYPFLQNAMVAFGFPDIIFQPDDAFVVLLDRQNNTGADVVLGLFPVEEPQKWDVVDMHHDGIIRQIVIKSIHTNLRHTWIIAVWTPVFTQFMHEYLSAIQKENIQCSHPNNIPNDKELFLGHVMQAAIDNHIRVEGVLFPDHTCLDIGTPDDLVRTIHQSEK